MTLEDPISCSDSAMKPCEGMDEPVDNGEDLALALSTAIEKLEVCQKNHHGELVSCILKYRADQLKTRKRLEEGK